MCNIAFSAAGMIAGGVAAPPCIVGFGRVNFGDGSFGVGDGVACNVGVIVVETAFFDNDDVDKMHA